MIVTTGKEYYYSVHGLMVPKYMVKEELTETLEYFVDWVPKHSEGLRTLAERKMDQFITEMRTLYKLICDIHAHWLEMESARILRLTEINERALCVKLTETFITNLRTLAIEIQMAQRKGFESVYRQNNEIEKCRDIISSMKIIATLIGSNDFEKAFDIAIGINELQESNYVMPVMSSITSRDEKSALMLAKEIIDVYAKRIDEINAVAAEEISWKKIVIVDDIPETLTALNLMLAEHYHVFAFTDGNEVLGFIDSGSQQPDAFILDIDMPGMDGFTLAKRIRARKKHGNTPIIFLTSDCARETIMRSALYNVKAFIVKPANKDVIISKLRNYLS